MRPTALLLLLQTRQWLDADSGLPLRSGIEVSFRGQMLQAVTMTAVQGPTLP